VTKSTGGVREGRAERKQSPMWFNIAVIDFECLIILTSIVVGKFKTNSIHIPEEGLSLTGPWLWKDCSFWKDSHKIKTEAPLGEVVATSNEKKKWRKVKE
jgi:hypothetical protein